MIALVRGDKNVPLMAVFIFAIATLLVSPFVGMKFMSLYDVIPGTPSGEIFWKLRVPRTLMAFLAGAGLSLSGMTFQAVFRNPLATPFTLGVSSGASLGAALYVAFGFTFGLLGMSGISVFAFAGSSVAIIIVYGLTKLRHGSSIGTMLLAGVAVSFFFLSVIMFIQYLMDFTRSYLILRWLMGGVDVVGYGDVANAFPLVAVGAFVVIYFSRELDLLMTDEDIAISRGVDTGRVKLYLFIATSLMVGGLVAICGPIGFVGMMAPHICRLIVGADHRTLAWGCMVFGGAFLVLCDTFSRTVVAPTEIPVGVVTALLGGPFFLWLLLGRRFGKAF
ncbi:Vitamin B12 ABC transporter, permease protein BtuC [hydrothermal vent metagenome]|uniref:Vitamin B12 ABC transporter, permease protein BtuC n=1 Tax=hydrothermal vent metagenome TaxID=652676 RepID=A0A3B1BW04_9ZZZZ